MEQVNRQLASEYGSSSASARSFGLVAYAGSVVVFPQLSYAHPMCITSSSGSRLLFFVWQVVLAVL